MGLCDDAGFSLDASRQGYARRVSAAGAGAFRPLKACAWVFPEKMIAIYRGNHPFGLEDAAKGPLRRRCAANSLRVSLISQISPEPEFTSAMSSIFPLRASRALVSNWVTGPP